MHDKKRPGWRSLPYAVLLIGYAASSPAADWLPIDAAELQMTAEPHAPHAPAI